MKRLVLVDPFRFIRFLLRLGVVMLPLALLLGYLGGRILG